MRSNFVRQLARLDEMLLQMCSLCEQAIDGAVDALLTGSATKAKLAVEAEKKTNTMEAEIESLCLKLLLLQQPVASDLRKISTALKMITDLERIGDQCADIAAIITTTDVEAGIHSINIDNMADIITGMVTDRIKSLVDRDYDLAEEVIQRVLQVDKIFEDIKQEIVKNIITDPHKCDYAFDMIMLTKYLERIGDHAQNIGEWAKYSITGIHTSTEP